MRRPPSRLPLGRLKAKRRRWYSQLYAVFLVSYRKAAELIDLWAGAIGISGRACQKGKEENKSEDRYQINGEGGELPLNFYTRRLLVSTA